MKRWYANPEVGFGDCVADIYATDGKRRVVFEVQLSRQSLKETIYRHNKLQKNGLKPVWLFRHIPNALISDVAIPAFEISNENGDFFLRINKIKLGLDRAIKMLLNREVRFRKKLTYKKKQTADIYKFEMECRTCCKTTYVIGVHSYYAYRCGGNDYSMDLHDYDLGKKLSLLQKQGVKEFYGIGLITEGVSPAYRFPYWSNSCKWCGTTIEKEILHKALLNYLRYEPDSDTKNSFRILQPSIQREYSSSLVHRR